MKGDVKKRGPLHRAADRAERFIEDGQVWVALAAAAGLLLMQIPWVSDLFAKLGVEDSPKVIVAIGVVLLTSILLELRQLKRSVTPAISGRQHYPDSKQMYTALVERAAEVRDPEHCEIEVLGLTLASAWPELESFLERPEVKGWRVKLATLSSDASTARRWVPGNWPQESETTVAQVMEFKARQGVDHDHAIEVFEYDFAPAIHGFRLGNGNVFLSTLRWRPDGLLGMHRFPYDFVPAHDASPEADAARALFKNWFDQAVCSAEKSGTE
ncbi:MAG: hypothetical protein QOI72_176 [Solirubrobacterales bacterium]|jgi:hypothetical protein|nr:hypothetical protein [Solirubrobacterales bacterium]